KMEANSGDPALRKRTSRTKKWRHDFFSCSAPALLLMVGRASLRSHPFDLLIGLR
ncbi:uncharacterized, partial [Tachysurus ichikawai]